MGFQEGHGDVGAAPSDVGTAPLDAMQADDEQDGEEEDDEEREVTDSVVDGRPGKVIKFKDTTKYVVHGKLYKTEPANGQMDQARASPAPTDVCDPLDVDATDEPARAAGKPAAPDPKTIDRAANQEGSNQTDIAPTNPHLPKLSIVLPSVTTTPIRDSMPVVKDRARVPLQSVLTISFASR